MAVSGNQFTRIGASISGVGIKLTINAKAEAAISPIKKVRRFISNTGRIGLR